MSSDFLKRQVERLLEQAAEALAHLDWDDVRARAQAVLALDPDNSDARELQLAADRVQPATSAADAVSISASPAAPAPPQPTSFAKGRYVVKRFLGEGGKKKVYLAHDASLDRDVAFALIKTDGLDEVARERITREAQAMGRLGTHPHIVTVFDIGSEGDQPYLVLPMLAGGDVEGVIEKAPEHKVAIGDAIKIATETCLGLEFVHGKGIVHRDLKPGNVWLTEPEQQATGTRQQGGRKALVLGPWKLVLSAAP